MLWTAALMFIVGVALVEGLMFLLCRAADRDTRRHIKAFPPHPEEDCGRVDELELDKAAREAAQSAVLR